MSVDNTVDATTFILQHTLLEPAPFVPEIVLYQGTDMLGLWQKIADREDSAPPPYWAFAWAGGQALARYILDHPGVAMSNTVLTWLFEPRRNETAKAYRRVIMPSHCQCAPDANGCGGNCSTAEAWPNFETERYGVGRC